MAEYRAIRNALPGDNLRINSTKSLIGHLLGAAGAVEAVAVIQAMQTGDTYCSGTLYAHSDLDSLPSFAEECSSENWLSDSYQKGKSGDHTALHIYSLGRMISLAKPLQPFATSLLCQSTHQQVPQCISCLQL